MCSANMCTPIVSLINRWLFSAIYTDSVHCGLAHYQHSIVSGGSFCSFCERPNKLLIRHLAGKDEKVFEEFHTSAQTGYGNVIYDYDMYSHWLSPYGDVIYDYSMPN